MTSLHSIEAIITSDKKEILKISGQLYGLNECANPQVTIYDKEGEEKNVLGANFPIGDKMPYSEFLEKIGMCQHIACSMKENRPTEYITSIRTKKIKESEIK